MTQHPDDEHVRPAGASDEAIAAAGKMSEALETVERARGHLYSFHQLIGEADFALDEVLERPARVRRGRSGGAAPRPTWSAATCSTGAGRSRSSRNSTMTTGRCSATRSGRVRDELQQGVADTSSRPR